MPPVSSGSRTALITWSVVFAILFVTASIFSIYFYADASKARESEAKTVSQYKEVASPGEIAGSDMVSALRDAKSNPVEGSPINASMSLLQVAVTQRDELSHMIAGPAVTTPQAALERARGESAALRNLANAARVLEGNPALMNLRLLQSLSAAQSAGNTLVLGVPGGFVPLKNGTAARSNEESEAK